MTNIELPERADTNGPAGHQRGEPRAWEQPLPPPPANPGRHRFLLLNGVLLVVVALLGTLGFETVFQTTSAPSAARTATAAVGTVSLSVSASGNISPAETEAVSFATGGAVTEVDVTLGQQVQAGQTLAKLDPTQARAALTAAQYDLAAAQDNLSLAQSGGETPPERAVDANSLANAQAAVSAGEANLTAAHTTYNNDLTNLQAIVDSAQTTLAVCEAQPACTELGRDQAALAAAQQSLSQTEAKDSQAITQAQSGLTQAQNSLTSTQLQTQAKQYVNPATIAQDQGALAQAEAAVNQDQKVLGETTLTAPFAGVVTSLNGAAGQTVSGGGNSNVASSSSGSSGSSGSSAGSGNSTSKASGTGSTAGGSTAAESSGSGSSSSGSSGSSFLTLSSMSGLQVVAGFAEADAVKIAVGQPALVTLSALPATTVPGVVTAVSPTATVVSNVVTYNDTVTLTNPPSTLRSGMTALVAVTVASRTGVLRVPSSAITTTRGVSTVTVEKNGQQVTQTVSTGLVGDTYTEITSGLSAGQVVVEPTATVSSGTATGTGKATGGTSGLGGGLGGRAGSGVGKIGKGG